MDSDARPEAPRSGFIFRRPRKPSRKDGNRIRTRHSRAGGTETILLVEDERAVRSLARRVLQARGYTVLEAENGDEAVFLCEQYAWPVHLVLTDMILPGINGRRVAERLKLLRPALKLLFMSGYVDDHGGPNANVPLLQKPFTPSGLARKVREVLDVPA